LVKPDGAIGVDFYLVNGSGDPINDQGTVINFKNRVGLDRKYLAADGQLVDAAQSLTAGNYTVNAPATITVDGKTYYYVAAASSKGANASPSNIAL
jgi:hypothetical protein